MMNYRGFQLIEYAVLMPRGQPGGVAVHDDLLGTVSDHPTMEDAKRWIDLWCTIANDMLARTLR